ncbi:hypothetical protein [Cereibacter changlensis]|uniref:hypothetical protein n=1 Tax=Cereibacter changlensis TaxID=402884 RepID=UPI0040338580
MSYPAHMNPTEAKIINQLITTILDAGHLIRVFDGEEYASDWTGDRAEIQKQTAATDYTVFQVADAAGRERIGTITLIHGNGTDVISDWSWKQSIEGSEALMDALVKPAGKCADKLNGYRS